MAGSRGARDAMNRAAPIYIGSITSGATAVKSSVSAYLGGTLCFAARTATVYVNFGETAAACASATTAMFPIAAGSVEEFEIDVYRKWISVISASTATLSYISTSLGKP